MQISPHFSLLEMTRSQLATRRGIRNMPSAEHLAALAYLCREVLEPVRALAGKPLNISSGYRCAELSEAMGSSAKSQHCRGEAADFEAFGISNFVLASAIAESELPFDQLILEFHNPLEGPNSGWIHISATAHRPPRRAVLTAVRRGGRVEYLDGLVV